MPHITSILQNYCYYSCPVHSGAQKVKGRFHYVGAFLPVATPFCISPLQDPPACLAHEIQTYITLTMDHMFSSGASESL